MFRLAMVPVGIFGAAISFFGMIDPSAGPVAFLFLFTFVFCSHLAMDAYDGM